jgi:hypothetical protein
MLKFPCVIPFSTREVERKARVFARSDSGFPVATLGFEKGILAENPQDLK